MNKKYTYRKYLALILLFSYSLPTHAMLKKARAYFDKKRAQRLYHEMGEQAQDFQGVQKEPEEQSQEDQDPECLNQENITITAHNFNNENLIHYIEAIYSKTEYKWGQKLVLEKTFYYAIEEDLLISTMLKINGVERSKKKSHNYEDCFDFKAIHEKVEKAVSHYRSTLYMPELIL